MIALNITDRFPLWVLFFLFGAIAFLSVELGWQLGYYRNKHDTKEKQAPIGAAVGSTLGLLAFLLAFTFGMAGSRFDTRKLNVLQEANAIGTTYLRAEFLPAPLRDEVRTLLREYTALRAGGVSSYLTPQGLTKSSELQDRLWVIAVDAQKTSNTVATGLFVQTLNQMIDMDATRVTAARNRIPISIWIMLGVVTIISMAALGYEFGLTGIRSWIVVLLLVIVFTTVTTLIADLDRPQQGLIQINQQPLIDLLNKISSNTLP